MKISIIVPCRSEKQHMAEFLDSLVAQEIEPGDDVEILVADGMSDDGTREVLSRYMEKAPAVRMIDNPGKIVSTGLNHAIAASTGDVVIRMDAHTVYAPDYVKQCVRTLEESGADNVGGPWVAEGRGIIGRAIAAASRSPFCMGGGKSHIGTYEGEVDTVYLGCWRRPVFERVGGFDPELVRNQDDELNFRIRKSGGRIWQSPRIRSSYTPRSSMTALFRQYLQYGFWKVAILRKHRSLASWRHAIPALFVGSILAALLAIAVAALFGSLAIAVALSWALAACLVLYFALCATAAVAFAGKVDRSVLLLLPPVITVHHVAYGLGFLAGMLTLFQKGTCGYESKFTSLTR